MKKYIIGAVVLFVLIAISITFALVDRNSPATVQKTATEACSCGCAGQCGGECSLESCGCDQQCDCAENCNGQCGGKCGLESCGCGK